MSNKLNLKNDIVFKAFFSKKGNEKYLKEFLEANTELWENDYQIFSFETWKDEENQKLMDDLMEFLGRENEGTPTVIIGSEVLVGYGNNMQDTYKKALDSQKEEEYDAIKEYQNKQQG